MRTDWRQAGGGGTGEVSSLSAWMSWKGDGGRAGLGTEERSP